MSEYRRSLIRTLYEKGVLNLGFGNKWLRQLGINGPCASKSIRVSKGGVDKAHVPAHTAVTSMDRSGRRGKGWRVGREEGSLDGANKVVLTRKV